MLNNSVLRFFINPFIPLGENIILVFLLTFRPDLGDTVPVIVVGNKTDLWEGGGDRLKRDASTARNR